MSPVLPIPARVISDEQPRSSSQRGIVTQKLADNTYEITTASRTITVQIENGSLDKNQPVIIKTSGNTVSILPLPIETAAPLPPQRTLPAALNIIVDKSTATPAPNTSPVKTTPPTIDIKPSVKNGIYLFDNQASARQWIDRTRATPAEPLEKPIKSDGKILISVTDTFSGTKTARIIPVSSSAVFLNQFVAQQLRSPLLATLRGEELATIIESTGSLDTDKLKSLDRNLLQYSGAKIPATPTTPASRAQLVQWLTTALSTAVPAEVMAKRFPADSANLFDAVDKIQPLLPKSAPLVSTPALTESAVVNDTDPSTVIQKTVEKLGLPTEQSLRVASTLTGDDKTIPQNMKTELLKIISQLSPPQPQRQPLPELTPAQREQSIQLIKNLTSALIALSTASENSAPNAVSSAEQLRQISETIKNLREITLSVNQSYLSINKPIPPEYVSTPPSKPLSFDLAAIQKTVLQLLSTTPSAHTTQQIDALQQLLFPGTAVSTAQTLATITSLFEALSIPLHGRAALNEAAIRHPQSAGNFSDQTKTIATLATAIGKQLTNESSPFAASPLPVVLPATPTTGHLTAILSTIQANSIALVPLLTTALETFATSLSMVAANAQQTDSELSTAFSQSTNILANQSHSSSADRTIVDNTLRALLQTVSDLKTRSTATEQSFNRSIQHTLHSIEQNLDELPRHIGAARTSLQLSPSPVPPQATPVIDRTLNTLQQTAVQSADTTRQLLDDWNSSLSHAVRSPQTRLSNRLSVIAARISSIITSTAQAFNTAAAPQEPAAGIVSAKNQPPHIDAVINRIIQQLQSLTIDDQPDATTTTNRSPLTTAARQAEQLFGSILQNNQQQTESSSRTLHDLHQQLQNSAASPNQQLLQHIETALSRIESMQILARNTPLTADSQQQILVLPIKIGNETTDVTVRFIKKDSKKNTPGKDGAHSIWIHVAPSYSGSVSAHLEYSAQKTLKLSLECEREATRQWFTGQKPLLQAAIERHGFSGVQISLVAAKAPLDAKAPAQTGRPDSTSLIDLNA